MFDQTSGHPMAQCVSYIKLTITSLLPSHHVRMLPLQLRALGAHDVIMMLQGLLVLASTCKEIGSQPNLQ